MSKKSVFTMFCIVLVLVFTLGLVPAAAVEKVNPGVEKTSSKFDSFPRNKMAPPGLDPMDLSVGQLGAKEKAIRQAAAQLGSVIATQASPIGEPAVVGDEFTFTVSDNGLGTDYEQDFKVVLEGDHGLILVTKDAYDSYLLDGTYYHFANPFGDDSEPWLRTEDLISHAQLTYLLDEFDDNIYPTVTTIFGEPVARGDEGQKVWILIFNIKDEAYYDPEAESYIAGYFSASSSAENNKNIMHIDTYDWFNRTGPTSARPFLYEGTFAHEFEHLVHFDIDPDEESWVDEGMADLAAFFCGYGHSSGHIAYYFVYHPFKSLTFWGNGLEDYGASYLFQLYLWEKYGGTEFISALVDEQANGIEGIENALGDFGYSISFDAIFDDWTIANYLDDTIVNPLYGYNTLTVGSADTWGYSIEYALQNFWVGDPFSITKKQGIGFYSSDLFGAPMPYTAHYYRFGGEPTLRTAFDGVDYAGTMPYSGAKEWYSGMEAWAWRSFYQTFTIPAGGATLNFRTFFEIEEDWDYGYVEVHDLVTDEWYTLEATGTTDTLAHPQDNPNTPAGREPTDYADASRWNAFTGNSGGWIPVSMDLDPFAGHAIELYFTTWQDGAFTLQMMYIDDISISELGFNDDVEAGVGDWTSSGWIVTDGILDNGWGAILIESLWQPTDRYPLAENWHARQLLAEKQMVIDAETQSGEITGLKAIPAKSRKTQVLIVTNHADHILFSDYWVEFTIN